MSARDDARIRSMAADFLIANGLRIPLRGLTKQELVEAIEKYTGKPRGTVGQQDFIALFVRNNTHRPASQRLVSSRDYAYSLCMRQNLERAAARGTTIQAMVSNVQERGADKRFFPTNPSLQEQCL